MVARLFILACSLLVPLSLQAATLVNINTATLSELDGLPGVGPATAQSIIDNRPYASISDVSRADGIGEPGSSSYEKIKDLITVGETSGGSTAASASTTAQASQNTQTASETASNNSAAAAPVTSYVAPPVPTLFADGGSDRTVLVGADVEFDGRAYNRDREIVGQVRFLWNFGDGTQKDGAAVMHHYEYPGRYAVVLTVAENRDSVSDYLIVTAEPARLTFAANPDGSVSVGNISGRDLDLSGWLVRSFGQSFALPEHTVVLSGETLRIPQATLKFYAGAQTELDYPNGIAAFRSGQSSPQPAPAPAPLPSATSPGAAAPRPAVRVTVQRAEAEENALSGAAATSAPLSEAAAAAGPASMPLWWLGALALALVGAGSAALIRHAQTQQWDITEIE